MKTERINPIFSGRCLTVLRRRDYIYPMTHGTVIACVRLTSAALKMQAAAREDIA